MKKILIPYDFSVDAENTLNYGVSLAKEISADLILLNVTPYPIVTPEIGLPAFSYLDIMNDGLKELHKLADRIRKETPSIQSVECFSEMGDITESIVECCKKNLVEFVVMGIHQHDTKLMKVLIGSNAVETSHKTKCSVIVIPPNTIYKRPVTIAFACDPAISAQDASLEKAKSISGLLNAELQLLHVIPEGHHFQAKEISQNKHSEHESQSLPHKLFIITEKKVSEGLLGMLDNKLIDIIIIEPKEHTLFYNLFHESVSKEVAFLSPVPVILMHS